VAGQRVGEGARRGEQALLEQLEDELSGALARGIVNSGQPQAAVLLESGGTSFSSGV